MSGTAALAGEGPRLSSRDWIGLTDPDFPFASISWAVISPGVLIFARSYFDFLRLRRKLDDENADFAALSEYTERSDADRIRSHFASGKTRILLYSERAHFYFRYKLKGVRDVVFYSLPDHCVFYSEILSMVDQGKIQQPTSTALFSKYDALQLGRVVGTREAKKMLTSETETFLLAA